MGMYKPENDRLFQRGLKVSHLQLMAALLEAGQVTLAAASIGVSQPAASRLLAEIETIIGSPVYQRTGRSVSLTAAGRMLGLRAQRVQMELRDAARELTEIANGGAGHVRIGSVTGPAIDRVLPAVRTARVTDPNVTIEVVVAPSDEMCNHVLSGRLDFAIGRLTEASGKGLLEFQHVASEPVSLVVRRGHPLARQSPVLGAELMEFDWVMPGPGSILTRAVMARIRAHGLSTPPQRLSTASFLLTFALLQQSNAIAPLSRAVADSFTLGPDAAFAQLPIDLGIEVEPYGLITRSQMTMTPAATRLAAQICGIDTHSSA